MKSHLYHLQINIDSTNLSFYKDLMTFLGWTVIYEDKDAAGFNSGTNGDVWFMKSPKSEQSDTDMVGVSHVSFRVEQMSNIDEFVTYLKSKNVECLFDTPKHRPEFAGSEQETYYQVMFKSPDNILFEVVYVGKK
jgi:catechol 2,3-dioxygenase-like lactoylglutathione lyase family enzyme